MRNVLICFNESEQPASVLETILSLGMALKIQSGVWYLRTDLMLNEIADEIYHNGANQNIFFSTIRSTDITTMPEEFKEKFISAWNTDFYS